MQVFSTNFGAFRLTQIRNHYTLLNTETDEAVDISRQQAISIMTGRGDKEELARALHWAVYEPAGE